MKFLSCDFSALFTTMTLALTPLVTRLEWVQLAAPLVAGPDGYKQAPEFDKVEVVVRTARCSMGGDDFDALGTEPPSAATMEEVKALATTWGFTEVSWAGCEKGLGTFYFKLPAPVPRAV